MGRNGNTVIASYTLKGELVKTYPNARVAAKKKHLYERTIDRAVRGDLLTAKSLQWRRYPIDEVPNKIEPIEVKPVNRSNRPIAMIDENNQIIKTYSSIREASKDNNVDPKTIRDNLSNKYNYKGKQQYRELTREEIERLGYQIESHSRIDNRPIEVYTLNGEYVETYSSISEASNSLNIKIEEIQKCLSSNISTPYRYIFKYQKSKAKKTKIYCYTLDHKLVKKYNSVKEAAIELGVTPTAINNCIRGEQKTCSGYRFKRK